MRLLTYVFLLFSLPALAQQTKSLVVPRSFTSGDRTLPIFNGLSGQLVAGSNIAVPTADDVSIPGQVNSASGNVTGALVTGTLSYAFASAQPFYLGTFADAGVVTLDINHNYFVMTNTGPTWSLNVPASMPDGLVTVQGINQSSVSPSVVTLSNAAIRPEQDSSVTTSQFTLPQSSSSAFLVYLSVKNGLINTFSVVGDTFTGSVSAAGVSFAPFGGITETTVQAAMQGQETRKANLSSLASVATNGAWSSLSGAPQSMSQAEANAGIGTVPRIITAAVLNGAILNQGPLVSALAVYASGTAAKITNTTALLDFGTTDPSLALTNTGLWRLDAGANVLSVGATFGSTTTVTFKLRRTNNTAADVTSATVSPTINVMTTFTGEVGEYVINPVFYTAASTNDIIQLWAVQAANPSPGSLQVDQAWITATRLGAAAADTTPPTLIAATVSTDGLTLTNVFSEPVTAGVGGFNGFTNTFSPATQFTYSSGDGTATLLYSVSPAVTSSMTGTESYMQGGTGMKDAAGNNLATFSGTTITNLSTLFAVTAGRFATGAGDVHMTSSTLVNWIDSKVFTLSFWPKHIASNGVEQTYFRNGNGRFRIYRGADNKLHAHAATTGGTTTLEMLSTSLFTTTNGYGHVLIAVNLANSADKHIYVNGLDVTDTGSITNNNNVMDLNNASMTFGVTSGAINFYGEASEPWLGNQYVNDPTLFASGGHPANVGATGNTPTGIAPAFYVHGPWTATPVLDNSGNANNFTVTGTITAGTPP